MYAALWRILPGPLWLRIMIAAVVVIALVVLLALVIYPWIATILPDASSTLN